MACAQQQPLGLEPVVHPVEADPRRAAEDRQRREHAEPDQQHDARLDAAASPRAADRRLSHGRIRSRLRRHLEQVLHRARVPKHQVAVPLVPRQIMQELPAGSQRARHRARQVAERHVARPSSAPARTAAAPPAARPARRSTARGSARPARPARAGNAHGDRDGRAGPDVDARGRPADRRADTDAGSQIRAPMPGLRVRDRPVARGPRAACRPGARARSPRPSAPRRRSPPAGGTTCTAPVAREHGWHQTTKNSSDIRAAPAVASSSGP